MDMTFENTPYTISVIGLGYVGCVSAACLARMGHQVIGVDVDPRKVEQLRQGQPTIVELGIEDMVKEQVELRRLRATSDIVEAIRCSDVCLLCVGTPSNEQGHADLSAIWSAAEQIKEAIRIRDQFLIVAIRSTVPPGTCQEVESLIAESGKVPGVDFAVVSNPEFLREGSSIQDYFNPSYTLIGTEDERAFKQMSEVYSGVKAPVLSAAREVAEMIKYVNNSFHALKVVFANEIGVVCSALGVDPHVLMGLFCRDDRLNTSSAYLKPGFAYGGSCLPKDVRALNAIARSRNLDVAVLSAIERSNNMHIERALRMIMAAGGKRIGILGLAFKSGTNDLRESPAVALVERLVGKGYEVMIHDSAVLDSLVNETDRKDGGGSLAPHLRQRLEPDLEKLMQAADVIVVSQKNKLYQLHVQDASQSKPVIDLVRISEEVPDSGSYKGLTW
ncbi:MAG: GDP-mannose dehydrogenase [Paenibacillus sp.]|jgi:GDP-mannose 6-dehydrogenase|nr:GDP-mannose dehydrogenase [Paenibacillus sp.]